MIGTTFNFVGNFYKIREDLENQYLIVGVDGTIYTQREEIIGRIYSNLKEFKENNPNPLLGLEKVVI